MDFICELEIRTQILILVWQPHYPLSHLSARGHGCWLPMGTCYHTIAKMSHLPIEAGSVHRRACFLISWTYTWSCNFLSRSFSFKEWLLIENWNNCSQIAYHLWLQDLQGRWYACKSSSAVSAETCRTVNVFGREWKVYFQHRRPRRDLNRGLSWGSWILLPSVPTKIFRVQLSCI